MKPITVSTVVDRPREEVYDFLLDLRNHEAFTDHMMVDWSGDADHIEVRSKFVKSDVLKIDHVEKVRPERTVEHGVSKGGKRLTTGTYRFAEAGPGRTEVTFEFRYLKAPAAERGPMAPLVRAFLHRQNAKAMRRLQELLAEPARAPAGA